jgi:hypothetical protein
VLSVITARFLWIVSSIVVAPLLRTIALAEPSTPLDGWHGYKFGMPVERARPILGAALDREAHISGAYTALYSRPMRTEFGPDLRLTLLFNDDQKLREITLHSADSQSADNCEKAFLKMLATLDARYGAFSPGGAKDKWGVPGDLPNNQRLLMRTIAMGLPSRQSRYWYRTFPANLTGLNIQAEAKRFFGSRWIEVGMYQKDGIDGCDRSIQFSADVPTKAQIQSQFKLKHIPANMDWHWAKVDRWLNGPSHFTTGVAGNVELANGRFAADVENAPGDSRHATSHIVGTISGNKFIAHVTSFVSDDYPKAFEGSITTFTIAGEPVDTYEIRLFGKGRWVSTELAFAAYHRNSAHKPAPAACNQVAEQSFRTRGSTRASTYAGLLSALGCKPS